MYVLHFLEWMCYHGYVVTMADWSDMTKQNY